MINFKVNGRKPTKQMTIILDVLAKQDTWMTHSELHSECSRLVKGGKINLKAMRGTVKILIDEGFMLVDKEKLQMEGMTLPRWIVVYSIA